MMKPAKLIIQPSKFIIPTWGFYEGNFGDLSP